MKCNEWSEEEDILFGKILYRIAGNTTYYILKMSKKAKRSKAKGRLQHNDCFKFKFRCNSCVSRFECIHKLHESHLFCHAGPTENILEDFFFSSQPSVIPVGFSSDVRPDIEGGTYPVIIVLRGLNISPLSALVLVFASDLFIGFL